MFLDPAQTLVGARVWENVEVIMPLELDTSGRSPTTSRPQPRMAEGLPQEEWGLLRLRMDGRRDEEEECVGFLLTLQERGYEGGRSESSYC